MDLNGLGFMGASIIGEVIAEPLNVGLSQISNLSGITLGIPIVLIVVFVLGVGILFFKK